MPETESQEEQSQRLNGRRKLAGCLARGGQVMSCVCLSGLRSVALVLRISSAGRRHLEKIQAPMASIGCSLMQP